MSDKYYLHDCNSYTHCSQNTYRIERKDSQELSPEDVHEMLKQPKKHSWWQRLWKQEKQAARA